MKICCLGPRFSFSEELAMRDFPTAEHVLMEGGVETLAPRYVSDPSLDYALVPVRNTRSYADKPFPEVLAGILQNQVFVVSRRRMNVVWHALAHVSLEKVETLYTHTQGRRQCSEWVDAACKRWGWRVVDKPSTSEAVRTALEDPSSAALGSERASVGLGLPIVERSVQGNGENVTEFYLLGRSLHQAHSEGCHALAVFQGDQDSLIRLPPFELVATRLVGGHQVIEVGASSADKRCAAWVAECQKIFPDFRVVGCFSEP